MKTADKLAQLRESERRNEESIAAHVEATNRAKTADDLPIIVMTIKGRFLPDLAYGYKKWELRKTRPNIPVPFRVCLCQSGTYGSIVATFVCRGIYNLTNHSAAALARMACITEYEAERYRNAENGCVYGWKIESFKLLSDRGMYVSDFGLDRAPQSWCYAKQRP